MMAATLAASAANINTLRSGQISFTEQTAEGTEVRIVFNRCMANNLYTFQSVHLDGVELNHTDSDNIGPFLIGSGWVGGNHTNPDASGAQVKSAKTVSVEAYIDGEKINASATRNYTGEVLTIKVTNTLYMPGQSEDTFATETMTYVVAGNSIDVSGEHEFTCSTPQRVDRYYGMQSMFIGETEMLTPGGMYATWTPIGKVDRFTRQSAPEFNTFIEHSANGYQAAWMDNSEGLLGNRSLVPDNDVVFIGNSSTKSYHKIIGSHTVKSGDKTKWHGIYSWFKEPLTDNCRGDKAGSFSYKGTLAGVPAVFALDADGKCTISTDSQAGIENVAAGGAPAIPFARSGSGCIIVDSPDATVYSITGAALHHGEGIFYCHAGIYIVADGHRSIKLIVK
ncbi:MAG: hypothetical protein K2L75_03075 [Muribaculaceae bacterium]|nr:hypothetical protein [Muribaculaceae bacterium]